MTHGGAAPSSPPAPGNAGPDPAALRSHTGGAWHDVAITPTLPVREVRLAVTMVGGISLAIYENGAAQELYSMCEGIGLYGLLKRLTHSHAYVDILSGTSAGGINNIFLGTALCARRELWSTRATWVDLADIDQLLPSPWDTRVEALLKGNSYYTPALEDAFRRILSDEPPTAGRVPSGLIPSGEYGDLDLFVTGTRFEGLPSTYADARNTPLFSQDFRGVFHLKHRPGRGVSHFHPGLREPATEVEPREPRKDGATPEMGASDLVWERLQGDTRARSDRLALRLARVARTTSSLPAVFETSAVQASLMNGVIPLALGRETHYFGDGGYLNNRPLDLVLAELYRRPAQREVVRKLVFVEPVAERQREPSEGDPPVPGALEHLAFWRRVPGEQTLAEVFRTLEAHNRQVETIRDALDVARRTARRGASSEQLQLWADLRLLDLRDQLSALMRAAIGPADGGNEHAWRERLMADEFWSLRSALGRLPEQTLALLRNQCRDYPTGAPPISGFELDAMDPPYLRRRAERARSEVYRHAYPESAPPRGGVAVPDVLGALACIQEKALVLERGLQDRVARRIDDWAGRESPLWRLLGESGRRDASPSRLQEALAALWSDLARTVWHFLVDNPRGDSLAEMPMVAFRREVRRRLATPFPTAAAADPGGLTAVQCLSEQVDALLDGVLGARGADPGADEPAAVQPLVWLAEVTEHRRDHRVRRGLRDLDAVMYPLERAADRPSLNPVSLVHISARDVQVGFSERSEERKLAGDALASFGGFLKRSWRVNDVMWGRLDTGAALLDVLLDEDRLAQIREGVRAAPGDWAPHVPAADRLQAAADNWAAAAWAAVREYLLGGPGPDPVGALVVDEVDTAGPSIQAFLAGAPDADSFLWLKDLLLWRHQMEILLREVPEAVGHAVAEHALWQGAGDEERASGAIGQAAAAIAPIAGRQPDRTVAHALVDQARAWALGLFGAPRQPAAAPGREPPPVDPARVREYFRQEYNVGGEDVGTGIPPLVNTRRVLGTALVALNLVRNSLTRGFLASGPGKFLVRAVLGPIQFVLGGIHVLVLSLAQGRAAAAVGHAIAWAVILASAFLISGPAGKDAGLRAVLLGGLAIGGLYEGIYWLLRGDPGRLARVTGWLAAGCLLTAGFRPPIDNLSGLVTQMSGREPMWGAGVLLLVACVVAGGEALERRFRTSDSRNTRQGAVSLGPLALCQLGVLATVAGLTQLGLRAPSLPLDWRWLAGGMAASAVLAARMAHSARLLAPHSILDLELRNPQAVTLVLRAWGRSGVEAARSLQALDYLFLVAYPVAVGAACTLASISLSQLPDAPLGAALAAAGGWLAVAQIVAGLCDLAENLAIHRFLRKTPGEATAGDVSPAIPWLARLKFGLVFLGIAYAIGGLSWWLVRDGWPARLSDSLLR